MLGCFFLQVFDVCFGVWDVACMVFDLVVVSRTGRVLAGKGENIDTVDEESALLDKYDATEVHTLLDEEEAVSIKGIGEDSDEVVAVTDVEAWISFSIFHFGRNFESGDWDWEQLTHFGSKYNPWKDAQWSTPIDRGKKFETAQRIRNIWTYFAA
ncbi:hypothetical protein TNCV_1898501 [Trichonephila clavipes]|uniref:Uncharacterized protein n=1 Tax=Trichonephila clavipes TaxID=2585209 RepID=A0A8X6WE64_TRICX|nr:hypothetical protein TNCV_1898501 [Trichonephila clavipes]